MSLPAILAPRRWAALVLAAGLPALADDGRILVANYGTDTVLSFALDGTVETAYGPADGVSGPFGANCIAVDRDGHVLVGNYDAQSIVRFPGDLVVADRSGGVASPDGLALADDGAVFVANRDGRNILRIDQNGAVSVFDNAPDLGIPMSLSIGGTRLCVVNDAGEIFCYDNFDSGTRTRLGHFGPGGNVAIAASCDGYDVYYLDDGTLQRVDTKDGSAVIVATGLGRADEGLVCVPAQGDRGALLFATDYAGVIYQVNPRTGEAHVFADGSAGLAGPSGLAWLPTYSPCDGFLRCDSNCDGIVDFNDIDAFVLALTDSARYQATYPACSYRCNNDADGDNVVCFDDIDAFVRCLQP